MVEVRWRGSALRSTSHEHGPKEPLRFDEQSSSGNGFGSPIRGSRPIRDDPAGWINDPPRVTSGDTDEVPSRDGATSWMSRLPSASSVKRRLGRRAPDHDARRGFDMMRELQSSCLHDGPRRPCDDSIPVARGARQRTHATAESRGHRHRPRVPLHHCRRETSSTQRELFRPRSFFGATHD